MNKKPIEKKTSTKKRIRPPFGYFGSKNKLALRLCSNLPKHNAWVEAFCGSAAVTLAKKPVDIEVINDIDDQIINLFDQLRKNSEQLARAIFFTPYAREELRRARSRKQPKSKLEKARRFLVESMMAVNGVFGKERGGFSYSLTYAREKREARVNRWYKLPKRISEVVERLRNVRVENRDALKLLNDYLDKPATLMYLDPPYLADRTNGYNKDVNGEEFHGKLLKLANKAKCMIFISGYESKLYREQLSVRKGWSSRRISTTTKDSSGHSHKRTEIVWMNKHFKEALKTKRVPVTLTKREKRLNKINPPRK